MKKIISLLTVAAMLASAMLFTVPANASKETSDATAENIDYVDALYFDKAPTIDGFVSEAEWGESSFFVEATDCATADDTEPYVRFIHWIKGAFSDYSGWSYDVWLRWDENYFYVAAKVTDPDVHSLKNGSGETWNGDAIQMKIDPEGPNAATGGEEFEINENYTLPWSSEAVPGFLFGYVQIAGGFSEAWDSTADKGMTSFSKNPLGTALCVVAPAGSAYSSDTQAGVTTYEVGIPWAYILNGQNDGAGNQISSLEYSKYTLGRTGNAKGGIGREFGMSFVNLDDGNNPDTWYDAWMAWGSGICGDHQTLGARSATGSNSVVLSDVKVTQTEYQKYDPTSLLDASFSTENWDKAGVFYDYLADDIYKEHPVKYEELTTIDYECDISDLTIWGWDDGYTKITDIGGEHGGVMDFSNAKGEANGGDTALVVLQTQDQYGSGLVVRFPNSYTQEFEIRYTDTAVYDLGYPSYLSFLFGGATAVDFRCGYFFSDNMFRICKGVADPEVIASHPYDLKKNNWYRWRFQFDNESCTARLWVDDLTTDADDGDGWGELIFNTCWRYFYESDTTINEEGAILCFAHHNVQAQYDNAKFYNFGSLKEMEQVYEGSESQSTGTGAATVTTQTGGGEVEIDTAKVYKKDGNWHVPVFAKSEYATATQLSFSLEYDPAKSEFIGIEGLAEGAYTVTETEKGKVQVVIKDFAAVKALKAGDKFFEFVLKALDGSAKAEDLGLKLSDSYVYTVTTGDAMTFIVIGGAFAIATVTAVLCVRRKKENE